LPHNNNLISKGGVREFYLQKLKEAIVYKSH